MFYFVTLQLGETVHAQALGLTTAIYQYCWADSPAGAERTGAAWCAGRGLLLKRASASECTCQDPRRFAFVESILGLPEADFEASICQRDYPASMVEDSRKKAINNRAIVAQGFEILRSAEKSADHAVEGALA